MIKTLYAAVALADLLGQEAGTQQTFHCATTEGRILARIVGEHHADIDDWPWQVLLKGTSPDGSALTCGGSITSPRCILTVAPSLVHETGPILTVYQLRYSVVYGHGRPLNHTGVPADRLIPYQEFNPGTLENDIALIRLNENTPELRLIQLPSERLENVVARPELCATVVGWGITSEGAQGSSGTLHRADLPVLRNSDRAVADPGEVTTSLFFAGYGQGGVESCQGASGGALMVRHGNNNRHVQVGVVS